MLPDAKVNAKNIFGTRGALYATHPDRETGVLYHWGLRLAAPLLDFGRGLVV